MNATSDRDAQQQGPQASWRGVVKRADRSDCAERHFSSRLRRRLAGGSEYAAAELQKPSPRRNKRFTSYIGMGCTATSYRRLSCATCWKIPGWYTAALSAGSLSGASGSAAQLQQVTLDTAGLASASLLDEATAAAEAMAMAKRVSKLKNANRFFVASDVHPQTLDVDAYACRNALALTSLWMTRRQHWIAGCVWRVLLQQVGTTGEIHDTAH
ncbi:hypothetical protein KCP70_06645 [Salmonella enterica subsp. enterica]|nr:hypothetical protein KCP70_06645 [Salmonella enterica subsp. enterica]